MTQEADTICLLFLSDSDQRILEYGCSYHTMYIYMWLVTSVCLYIYMSLAYERVLEKCFWDTGKSWKFFRTKEWESWLWVV